jgi:subtilisin family serine protease
MIARIFVFTLVAVLFGYGPSMPLAQEPMQQAKGKIIPFSNKQEAVYGEEDATKEDSGRVVPKSTYVDKGDYYYLSDGKMASFLRLKNTYVLMSDPKKVSAQTLSQTIQARFGEQLAVIKEHPLTGYVVVQIKEEALTSSILAGLYQTDPTISNVAQVLTNKERGGTLAVLPHIVVKVSADADKKESIAELERMNLSLVSRLSYTMTEFEFEIDEYINDVGRIFEITREVAELPFVDWAEPNFLAAPIKQFTPNDPMYNNQWHLNNTGQNGAVVDADIDAPEGWDTSRGDGAVIAVFDDGVDTGHEDLTIWANPGETGAGKESNGIDDDGNGYIDDYQGWDFGDNDNDPSPATVNDNHGTSVAGVAGATGNNGVGVSGGAVGAMILPVRSGSMTCTQWGNAMRYAGKYGDVVNNSWGISGCESSLNSAIADVVNGNIPGARRGNKGTPVLFATGNAASGWLRFSLSGIPAGTYDFHWKFVKDISDSQGYDTVWLDNIAWPGGGTTDFESDTVGTIPTGFTSDGNATWSVVSDGTHARGATGKSVKAGTITHSQETNLRITQAVGAGTLTYWAWVSSEYGYDFMEFYVNGTRYHMYYPGQYGEHTNAVGYPASNPDTIAVGASTDGGPGGVEERSYYSQFGPELDVVAPSSGGGQDITTTDRMGAAGYSSSNYTSTFGGTSSATPLVSGVVADMLACNPNLTAAQVRQALRDGADKIGPYLYSRNDYYGYGRVNLYNTLQLVCGGAPPGSNSLVPTYLLLLDD